LIAPPDVGWHRAARLDELREDDPMAVTVNGVEIALFKIGTSVYATGNVCPHEYALLSDGFVDGVVIECPLHQARFHIPSGALLSPPAARGIETFSVRIDGGEIFVQVPDASEKRR
jgi:3-phenylpropionate/trans-cinnamate dioxygenase ferredoxin subunit